MGYETAINKAWEELKGVSGSDALAVRFLADEYSVDISRRKILSLSCNVPAKDFAAILILHYLIQSLKKLPALTGEWLTFREFSGIEGYYPAFRRRSIEIVIRKYGKNPKGLFEVLKRLPGKKAQGADAAVMLEPFPGVPILIKLWRSDEDFGPDANIFFDKNISGIFCTEDIIVLAQLVAVSL
jgi:hypothetical protein